MVRYGLSITKCYGVDINYLPSIDFIPPPVYFVGVLNDHCQILIDAVQLSDKHNKAIRLNFCVFYFYTV